MCNRLRQEGRVLSPGERGAFILRSSMVREGTWGLNKGQIINAREERLAGIWDSLYKTNRGIIEIEEFTEKGIRFSDGTRLSIAVIYNDSNEFAVITTPSKFGVECQHPRMPLVLRDRSLWLEEGKIAELQTTYKPVLT